jgi:TPR repeat protein
MLKDDSYSLLQMAKIYQQDSKGVQADLAKSFSFAMESAKLGNT